MAGRGGAGLKNGIDGATPRPGRRLLLRAGAAVVLAASAAATWRRVDGDAERDAGPSLRGPLRVIDERRTPFGRLQVVESGRTRLLAYAPVERLVYQSAMDLDHPERLLAPYTRLMMLGVVYAQPCRTMLQVGVGAGSMLRYALRTFPDVEVHGIEIDADTLELARLHFGLAPQPRLHLHHADGRAWLQRRPEGERFDAILLDAYDDASIPAALKDATFFRLVAGRLSAGGVAMQNVFVPQVDLAALTAAMRTAFEQIDVHRVGPSAVLAAYQGPRRERGALLARARELDAALRPAHPLAPLLQRQA